MTTDITPTTAAEPTELTPVQYALLDAFKDVALSAEAPGAKYATEQLARLTAAAFGYPLPEPVQREGGIMGMLYGRPVTIAPELARTTLADAAARRQQRATGGPVDPKRLVLVGEREGEQLDYGTHADPPPPDEDDTAAPADPWPFNPGDVVDDIGGAITEWLDAAPEGTLVVVVVDDAEGDEWEHHKEHWCSHSLHLVEPLTSSELAAEGTLKVVRVGKGDR